MLYFLDFDRTLFDADAYNEYLLTLPALAHLRENFLTILAEERDHTRLPSERRTQLWDTVSELINSGALSFEPGELSQFIYSDVPEMLRSLGNEAIIITYGEKGRQKAKIESALAHTVRLTVLYTGTSTKGEFLAEYPHLVPGSAVFVDDIAEQLRDVGERFPHIQLFEIRRDGRAGSGEWPTISSLTELP